MLRDGANTACQSRLSGRHQTQIFASPPVRTTANTNFRISACHGYPERHLHTASCQHRLSGRRQTPIFTSPLVTATPWDVYITNWPAGDRARSSSSRRLCVLRLPHERQLRARRRPRAQQLLQQTLCTAPAIRTPAAGQPATTRAAAPPEGSA